MEQSWVSQENSDKKTVGCLAFYHEGHEFGAPRNDAMRTVQAAPRRLEKQTCVRTPRPQVRDRKKYRLRQR